MWPSPGTLPCHCDIEAEAILVPRVRGHQGTLEAEHEFVRTAHVIEADTMPGPNDLGLRGCDAIAEKGGQKMPGLKPELLDVGQELVGDGELSPAVSVRRTPIEVVEYGRRKPDEGLGVMIRILAFSGDYLVFVVMESLKVNTARCGSTILWQGAGLVAAE
jgi:hypothetical protein